jgi:hypothetical protein
VKKAIILSEVTNGATVAHVIAQGYAPDLNDVEMEKIGRDPFLVSAALGGAGRVVVTRERSRPAKQRANRKVPDVCGAFAVAWFDDFELWRVLDFRIE